MLRSVKYLLVLGLILTIVCVISLVADSAEAGGHVAMGDSITHGTYDDTKPQMTYPNILGEMIGSAVVNKGISGQTTTQMLARFSTDVLVYDPDYVYIMGGVNDIATGATTATIISNLDAMVDAAVASGARVYLITILPNNNFNAAQNADLATVNDWIMLQGTGSVVVVDAHSKLCDPGTPTNLLPAYVMVDGLHLKAEGMAVLAGSIIRASQVQIGDYDNIKMWAAPSAGTASTPTNWEQGEKPVAGDTIIFTSNSTQTATLNEAVSYGRIFMAAGCGTVTFGITGIGWTSLYQHGGAITSTNTYVLTFTGDIIQYTGTLPTNTLNLIADGDDQQLYLKGSFGNFYKIDVKGNLTLMHSISINAAAAGWCLIVEPGASLEIASGAIVTYVYYNNAAILDNRGTIFGEGKLKFTIYDGNKNLALRNSTCAVEINLLSAATGSRTVTFTDFADAGAMTLSSSHASNTLTVDFNDNDVDASGIIVGVRSVLKCGEGVVSTTSLDSSAGTVTEETAQWIFSSGALVKLAGGGTLYDVNVDGITLRLGSDVTMNSLTFTGLESSHPYGWYVNAVRNASVASAANGTYALAGGTFTWDNVTLKITPVITIGGWEHTDGGFRNIVWQGYDYWADHDCDLLVTWTLSASENWLSIDGLGNITGTPEEDGTCYYTISATADNGEIAMVSGHIVVETSTTQSAMGSVGALAGALVLVVIVSSMIMMVQRFRPQ